MKLKEFSALVAFAISIGFTRFVSTSNPQQIDDRNPRDEAQDYLDAFYGTAPDPAPSSTETPTTTKTTTSSLPTNIVSSPLPHIAIQPLANNSKAAPTELPTNRILPVDISLFLRKNSEDNYDTDVFDLAKLLASRKPIKRKQEDKKPLSFARLRAALAVSARRAGVGPVDEVVLTVSVNSTTTEPTPFSDMVAFSRLVINSKIGHYGNACIVYGDTIEKEQKTGDPFEEDGRNNLTKFTKKENDEYQEYVCKLSQRLECVRDRYVPETTDEPDEADEDIQAGTCRCLRALSDRAIYMTPDSNNRRLRRGCYIPAGFGQSSRCGHIVPLPYGIIRTVGRNARLPLKDIAITQRHVGNTSLMCVPNAECRTSTLYIGRRCFCNKNSFWHHHNGTCERIVSILDRQNGCYKPLQSRTMMFIIIAPVYIFTIFGKYLTEFVI